MKRLISTDEVNKSELIEQIKEYWYIVQNQFNLRNKNDCKNSIMEFLQFNNLNYDDIEDLTNEIYDSYKNVANIK